MMGPLDGRQVDLANSIAPLTRNGGASIDDTLIAVAVLAGAAAAQATRLADVADHGKHLDRSGRVAWGCIVSLLMEIADRATPGMSEEDRKRRFSALEAALSYEVAGIQTGAINAPR